MKSKTMILLVLAVVCGLGASYMTSRLLADRNEKVTVVVAKTKVNGYTMVKNADELFELEERPKQEVPKEAVTSLDAVKENLIIKSIEKGDPLLIDNMMDKSKIGLEATLPMGKRAVAVRTTAEVVAGGFVLPGSRVDVIHAYRRGDGVGDTRTILQNIQVLAVDQQAMKPEDRPGMVPATVTLQVTPAQAVILASVKDAGALTFALRPLGDDKIESQEAPKAPAPPKPKEVTVEKPPEKKPEPPPVVVKTEPPPKKDVVVIHNGNSWVRATYQNHNGETRSTIEHGAANDYLPAPPAPPAAPAATPSQPAEGTGVPPAPKPKEGAKEGAPTAGR